MKKLKTRIIIEGLSLTCAIGCYLCFLGKAQVAWGLLIGTLAGLICFLLLASHIQRSLSCRVGKYNSNSLLRPRENEFRLVSYLTARNLARKVLRLPTSLAPSVSCNLGQLKAYFFLKYLIRYAIMGTTLFFCVNISLELFTGAACGLILVHIVIFLDAFIWQKQLYPS